MKVKLAAITNTARIERVITCFICVLFYLLKGIYFLSP
jgi:hypothetical protein